MAPEQWIACTRADDGELLGYLVPEPDGKHTPVTVFGSAIDTPGPQADAEQRLQEVGLSYLAERWVLDVDDRDEPIAVQIVEANPHQVIVKSVDHGYSRDYGTLFTLAVPVDRRLRRG